VSAGYRSSRSKFMIRHIPTPRRCTGALCNQVAQSECCRSLLPAPLTQATMQPMLFVHPCCTDSGLRRTFPEGPGAQESHRLCSRFRTVRASLMVNHFRLLFAICQALSFVRPDYTCCRLALPLFARRARLDPSTSLSACGERPWHSCSFPVQCMGAPTVRTENKRLLGFVSQKESSPLPKLMLRGAGTFSPLRCRCERSSWPIAR